jgi:hypothetical protein
MHDAQIVRFTERGQRLSQDLDDARKGQRPFLVSDAREILAAQKFHHQIRLAVVGTAEVEHGDRVRMVQLAGCARFGHEAERGVFIRQEMRMDDLDRDGAAERRLLRAVHAAHAADADQVEDVVTTRQRLADELVVRGRTHGAHGKATRGAVLMLGVAGGATVRTGSVGHLSE